jgi:hypothetical protein
MGIGQLLNNAKTLRQGLQDGALVRSVLERHGDEIIEQQRIQLLEGKAADGSDMHPFYSEDLKPKGYFHSRATAANYAAWKQTISYPYTVRRNHDAPNLYITGIFHNDLQVVFSSDWVGIVPDTMYAAVIMNKYGKNAFGLCPQKWDVMWNEKGCKSELITKMRETLWQ